MNNHILNTKFQLRRDTLEHWQQSDTVLIEGEPGIAIDPKTGVSILKIGDGVHLWKDLTLQLGEKNPMEEGLQKLQKAAAQMEAGMKECAEALQSLAQMGAENTLLPGDSSRSKYKTLNIQHEVI